MTIIIRIPFPLLFGAAVHVIIICMQVDPHITYYHFLFRCIKGPLSCILPSLDQKCCPKGCWYCSDLCQHCMQPSPTLYSGTREDNLLKFCSEECKKFWFPTPDQKPLYIASYLDETCQSQESVAPLMTAIIPKKDGVEQIYFSVGEESDKPYIIWHIRELEHQYFAHFYISKDCLPLNSVWPKQYCTVECEAMYNYISTNKLEVQSQVQIQLNQAAKEYGFEDFDAFLKQVKNSQGVSLYHSK